MPPLEQTKFCDVTEKLLDSDRGVATASYALHNLPIIYSNCAIKFASLHSDEAVFLLSPNCIFGSCSLKEASNCGYVT